MMGFVEISSNKEMRIIPPSAGSSVNFLDVFIEALILFLAGAMGMLLPLLAMNSGSVSFGGISDRPNTDLDAAVSWSNVHRIRKCFCRRSDACRWVSSYVE
jgi:hypothetical protein